MSDFRVGSYIYYTDPVERDSFPGVVLAIKKRVRELPDKDINTGD